VFPATDASATISFNQLHAECQTRIQQKRWCPQCQKDVPNTDIVKGYEFEKGRWVVVDEDDIEKMRVESTRVINLETFTDDVEIDPIYLDKPYYLAPDGPVAKEAFAVIREGMKGKAGIGKVALYGREYLIKVQPRERGLVMYTLRHASEIRSMDAIDELADMPYEVKPAEGRRPRVRGPARRRSAQGREPDGSPAPEPRFDQRREEEDGRRHNHARDAEVGIRKGLGPPNEDRVASPGRQSTWTRLLLPPAVPIAIHSPATSFCSFISGEPP